MSLSRLARDMRLQQGTVEVAPDDAPRAPVAATATADGFDALVKYIPTETVTLFVAAMAALPALTEVAPGTTPWMLYAASALLTPVILVLIAYGRHRQSGEVTAFKARAWPIVASLVAFLVWALSVPGLIPDANWAGKVLAGFGALFISTLLSILEPVFGPVPA